MTPAQRCDEIIRMIDEVLDAVTPSVVSAPRLLAQRCLIRSLSSAALGSADDALRVHHRGYSFWWISSTCAHPPTARHSSSWDAG